MKEHRSPDDLRKELDGVLSKINALEILAQDEFQKGIVKVLRRLTEGQIQSINEFEHIKKALDLTMLQLFEIKNQKS